MNMLRIGIVFFVLLGLLAPLSAPAAELTLTGQNIFVANPDMDGVYTTGNSFLVGFTNSQIDSQLIGGWILDLAIVKPDTGATGTLHFDVVKKPTSDYILEPPPSTLGVSEISFTDTTANFWDYISGSPFGKAIPASSNFLELSFKSPDNATGTFEIVAMPGLSLWTDVDEMVVLFTNVPEEGAPVVIGTVTIIPEPATLGSLAMGGVLLGVFARRRRRRWPMGLAA